MSSRSKLKLQKNMETAHDVKDTTILHTMLKTTLWYIDLLRACNVSISGAGCKSSCTVKFIFPTGTQHTSVVPLQRPSASPRPPSLGPNSATTLRLYVSQSRFTFTGISKVLVNSNKWPCDRTSLQDASFLGAQEFLDSWDNFLDGLFKTIHVWIWLKAEPWSCWTSNKGLVIDL